MKDGKWRHLNTSLPGKPWNKMLSPCLIQIFINGLRLPETDARKTITVPWSGQLLILHWYSWNRSSFVHTCVKYRFLSSPEHRDSHTDGIKRSQWDESPRGLGTLTHVLVLSFWKKSKGVKEPCAPFTPTVIWGTSKHSRCHRQSVVGLGTKSRFPESSPVS